MRPLSVIPLAALLLFAACENDGTPSVDSNAVDANPVDANAVDAYVVDANWIDSQEENDQATIIDHGVVCDCFGWFNADTPPPTICATVGSYAEAVISLHAYVCHCFDGPYQDVEISVPDSITDFTAEFIDFASGSSMAQDTSVEVRVRFEPRTLLEDQEYRHFRIDSKCGYFGRCHGQITVPVAVAATGEPCP